MSAHPISGRKARAILGASISALNRQAQALVELNGKLKDLDAIVTDLTGRTLWGRLKWLLTGH